MSQVLQCTQFEKLIFSRRPPLSSTISYTAAGQKYWQGLPYSTTQRLTQMFSIENVQVAGLILFVTRAGMIDVGQPVKGENAIALKARRRRTRAVELVILLIAGRHAHRVDQAAPAGHKLCGRVRQAEPQPVLE